MKNSVISMLLLCLGFLVAISEPVHAQPALLGLRPPVQQPGQQSPAPLEEQGSVRPQAAYPALPAPPATLVLPAGTIITIEASEYLSSNKQHVGDSFVAELQQPVVVDGWVVARPGQTVIGRVAEAKRAGRVKGTSKLSLQLQQMVLVDGLQVAVESELVENSGSISHGRDLAAVAITTGIGAAIGAVCGAKGAAIGAAAGAAASIAGVLLTRGKEIEVSPEKLLTFRLAAPLTVSTVHSQNSFWQVTPDDYIVPDEGIAGSQNGPIPVIVAKPLPRRTPVTVWPGAQGLAVGRPGQSECGS